MTSLRSSPLAVQREGPLLLVTLRRSPDNLIDRNMAAELRDLCTHLTEEGDVRLVLLTGVPDGPFSRGTDPSLLGEAPDASSTKEAHELLEAYRCASALAYLHIPVIAAVEGDAWDQGLELALAADLRIASEEASFRMGQVTQGVIPWDGGTQRLPRVVGSTHALDLVLTGRTVDALEGHRLGLVDRLAPPGKTLEVARELAGSILESGPIAAQYAKEAVQKGMDLTLEQGILLETDLTMVLQTTADRMEGIRSFLERRKPVFRGQ